MAWAKGGGTQLRPGLHRRINWRTRERYGPGWWRMEYRQMRMELRMRSWRRD